MLQGLVTQSTSDEDAGIVIGTEERNQALVEQRKAENSQYLQA
jgi:hypothetical protein